MQDGTQTTGSRRRRTYEERVAELRQKELARIARRQASLTNQYREASPVRARAIKKVEDASARVRDIVAEYADNLISLDSQTSGVHTLADVTDEMAKVFTADDVRDWLEAYKGDKGNEADDHTDGTDGVLRGQLSISDN